MCMFEGPTCKILCTQIDHTLCFVKNFACRKPSFVGNVPTRSVLSAIAFLLQTFAMAQGILVSIIAVTAFLTIQFNRRAHFGRYDWVLLALVVGAPVTVGIAMLAKNWLGPNGYW